MAHEFELAGDPVQHADGRGCEFVVIIKDSDPEIPAHGETVYCKADHAHSKACAIALMKEKPVVGKDDKGKDILGKSKKELAEEWLAAQRGGQKPTALTLPTKKAKNDKGDDIDVPDKSLSLA